MKRLIFLAMGMFALGCDDYIFAGLLPGISASLRTSFAGAAQGVVVFGVTYVAALPICAFLLAKKPARQVLLLALITFVAGNVMTLMSTNLLTYIGSRAIAGIGAGLCLPIAVAVAVQLADSSAKGRALSLIWGFYSAGAVLGVPTGLWLADRMNWRASICMILLLSLIALAGTLLQNLDLKVSAPPSLREQARLLADRDVMSISGITFITAVSGLGLYAYIAPVLSGSMTSSASALSLWNVGGLIGSIAVGYVVDRIAKPQRVMAMILATLMVAIILLPTVRSFPILGLFPFLLWGAMGWATVTPQQYSLIQLKPGKEATLIALNSSAVSLGGAAGAAIGGLALTSGLHPRNLPYAAAGLLFCALAWQILLIQQQRREA